MDKFKDNVAGWCYFLLLEGELSDKEIIAFVRKRFSSKTSMASMAWYKNKLREEGLWKSVRHAEVLDVGVMREMMKVKEVKEVKEEEEE